MRHCVQGECRKALTELRKSRRNAILQDLMARVDTQLHLIRPGEEKTLALMFADSQQLRRFCLKPLRRKQPFPPIGMLHVVPILKHQLELTRHLPGASGQWQRTILLLPYVQICTKQSILNALGSSVSWDLLTKARALHRQTAGLALAHPSSLPKHTRNRRQSHVTTQHLATYASMTRSLPCLTLQEAAACQSRVHVAPLTSLLRHLRAWDLQCFGSI